MFDKADWICHISWHGQTSDMVPKNFLLYSKWFSGALLVVAGLYLGVTYW
jgi:hypothetical protein